MKSFTGISDSLYTLFVSVGVYICDGVCLDLFKYFQRCLVKMKNH